MKKLWVAVLMLWVGALPALAQLELRSAESESSPRKRGPGRDGRLAAFAQIEDIEDDDEFGFGKRVAGTFLGELFTEEGELSFFQFVLTLNADGTVESSDTTDFLNGLETASMGVWRRTGPLQLTIRQLYFRFDQVGNLFLVGRDTAVVDFDPELDTASGTLTGDAMFPPDLLDPLDPNAGEPLLSSTNSFRMSRQQVDVPWGSTDGDDEPELATPIACPAFVSSDAAIETFDDRDFYVLNGNPGETVEVDVDAQVLGSPLDSILGAFDSELNLLRSSDDNRAPGEPSTFDSYLSMTLPADGVLFIAVAPFTFPFGFENPGYSIGTYTLSVSCGAGLVGAGYETLGVMQPELAAGSGNDKPGIAFAETYRGSGTREAFGQQKKLAGTYLLEEEAFFGPFYDLVTFHADGTFSLVFEGGLISGTAAVRGKCERRGPLQLICEGLDLLHQRSGEVALFDRISFVFDFEPDLEEASGYQVTQEAFRPRAMLDPPDPNVSIEDDDFFQFGLGAVLPRMTRIDVPVEQGGTKKKTGTSNLGFGKRVAGAFLGEATGVADPAPEFFLAKLNADGTFVASDTSDFAFGLLDGPVRGVWERSGPRRITIVSLGLLDDPDVATRTTMTVDFDEEFEQATGTLAREFFMRSQILEPLDPNTDEQPVAIETADFTMKRLLVPQVEAGEGVGDGAGTIDRGPVHETGSGPHEIGARP